MEIFFLWVSVATFIFLVKQLYAGLRYGELHVRSGVYNRQDSPIHYWAAMFTVMSGITFFFLMIAACVSLVLSG